MTRIVIHTDDLPQWALRTEKLPHSYLDQLKEPLHPSPDGKGMISAEEIMMQQQFDAALKGNATAMKGLLRMIIAENGDELAACKKHPWVRIEGVVYYQPLAPVLALLGCATVKEPEVDGEGPSTIELAPWFAQALEDRTPPEKLARVKAWLDAGGKQKPRIRNCDSDD